MFNLPLFIYFFFSLLYVYAEYFLLRVPIVHYIVIYLFYTYPLDCDDVMPTISTTK